MQENTNQAILINSIISYARLAITSVCGLMATRFALQALGVNDFGIYSLVGSVMTFIGVVNTIMLSTSNRFIAVAIGKGNEKEINEQFNVNLLIHCSIALVIIIAAFPLGNWYIENYVNYEGNIDNVIKVFNVSVIGSVISFVGVPYNGLLIAKERFFVFCLTDVIGAIIKVIVSFAIIDFFVDKLLVYSIALAFISAFPVFVFHYYCKKQFPQYVSFRLVRNRLKYREMFSFSIWIGYGAFATIGKSQGSAIIVNTFFNTIMNTALGIAQNVNAILSMLATNVTRSIAPQITKSYASGDMARCEKLVCLSSKVAFLFMLFVSSPFLVEPDFIFNLWLGQVPEYVVSFVTLLIIDTLVGAFNSGIPDLIFATGKIKWYQIIVNTIFIISVVVGFFILKAGAPAGYLFLTYIVFSVIALIIRQIILNKIVHFNSWSLIKKSYLPSLVLVLFFLPLCIFHLGITPVLNILITWVYLFVISFYVVLNKTERERILEMLRIK